MPTRREHIEFLVAHQIDRLMDDPESLGPLLTSLYAELPDQVLVAEVAFVREHYGYEAAL